MIKKSIKIITILLVLFISWGGINSNAKENKKDNINIFPARSETWVGDPMPYYDGEKFNIFYLEDLRDGDIGFHPWSLFTTENFYEYEDIGEVIPYSRNTQDQDLALGTGSVIKDNSGVYHAFYTGHNPKMTPKEAIMHATSVDMNEWTKIPEDTFYAADQYEANDFRDPYVFYNEDYNEYWMLITTRKENTGVIALYTSSDLKNWEDNGVIFSNDMGTDSNLECPTLIKYGEYWYLSFSDQWPERVVHYRIAKDSKGLFEIPKQDHFDGNGFYAGRLEKDSENLYIFGWTPTKTMYSDSGDYDWAGNLVVHQLKQKDNGELYPVPVKSVVDMLDKDKKIKMVEKSDTVVKSKNKYEFTGNDYEYVVFPEIDGINKITGRIKLNSNSGKSGFMFNVGDKGRGDLNIVFNHEKNLIEFYNSSTEDMLSKTPQSIMPLDIIEDESIEFTILIDDSVVGLYVNDKAVMSTRMFSAQGQKWGIFSIDNAMVVEDLKLSQNDKNKVDNDTESKENIADLQKDFGYQGNNGWCYGYGTSSKDFIKDIDYNEKEGVYYKTGLDGFEIKKDFVHPAKDKGAIYSWQVRKNGKIDITGEYIKFAHKDSDESWPDGVKLTIYHNDSILQENIIGVSSENEIVEDINITGVGVKKGDNLYFVINDNENNAWDGGRLNIGICEATK